MIKVYKTVWRTRATQKDLISHEPGKFMVHLYDATPEELAELRDAIEECLDRVEFQDFKLPPKPFIK